MAVLLGGLFPLILMAVCFTPGHTAEFFLVAIAEFASDLRGGYVLDRAVPVSPLAHRFDLLDQAGCHHRSIAFAAMFFLRKYARFI